MPASVGPWRPLPVCLTATPAYVPRADDAGFPKVVRTDCASTDISSVAVSASPSSLKYSSTEDQYSMHIRVPGARPGWCMRLELKLTVCDAVRSAELRGTPSRRMV